MTRYSTQMAIVLTRVLNWDKTVMKTKAATRLRRRRGPQLLPNVDCSPIAADLELCHNQAMSPCEDLRVQIARRAYQLQVARGYRCGDRLDEWHQAEQEILGQSHAEC